MITDKTTTFALGTALATATGTSLLGDVIPLSNARDIGEGNPIYLVISMAASAASAGSATVEFSLVSDAQEAIATDGSATVHIATGAIPVAEMAAGETLLNVVIPMEGLEYETYLGVLQTTATAALTEGNVNVFLTQTPANWKAVPAQTGYVS